MRTIWLLDKNLAWQMAIHIKRVQLLTEIMLLDKNMDVLLEDSKKCTSNMRVSEHISFEHFGQFTPSSHNRNPRTGKELTGLGGVFSFENRKHGYNIIIVLIGYFTIFQKRTI